MKRSRFTEEQIIGILREHQAGATAVDLYRKNGISDASFDKWLAKEVAGGADDRRVDAEGDAGKTFWGLMRGVAPWTGP